MIKCFFQYLSTNWRNKVLQVSRMFLRGYKNQENIKIGFRISWECDGVNQWIPDKTHAEISSKVRFVFADHFIAHFIFRFRGCIKSWKNIKESPFSWVSPKLTKTISSSDDPGVLEYERGWDFESWRHFSSNPGGIATNNDPGESKNLLLSPTKLDSWKKYIFRCFIFQQKFEFILGGVCWKEFFSFIDFDESPKIFFLSWGSRDLSAVRICLSNSMLSVFLLKFLRVYPFDPTLRPTRTRTSICNFFGHVSLMKLKSTKNIRKKCESFTNIVVWYWMNFFLF